MTVEIVALIAAIVSIILAGFAIWQANHHRDQSDKLNRDTTEKLARIEAFATSTKEDAFDELKKWSEFARAGGKALEEVEKAKEEELRKLKEDIQVSTSAEINKVLQAVENKLSSSTATSTLSEIKKEFEELKREIGKIQEKGLGDVNRLETQKKFSLLWLMLSPQETSFLAKLLDQTTISNDELERAGMPVGPKFLHFVNWMMQEGVISFAQSLLDRGGLGYRMELSPAFKEFLDSLE